MDRDILKELSYKRWLEERLEALNDLLIQNNMATKKKPTKKSSKKSGKC
jgi:hypothetical protein